MSKYSFHINIRKVIDLKFVLVFIFLFCIVQLGICQESYNAIILEQNSNQPIHNVNILVVNSTEGYYSDKEGKFSMPRDIAAGSDLIFSHVNYEASCIFVPLDYANLDTVYLSPISHEIEKVTITSKKNNLKKKRLLLFRKDLFDYVDGKKNMYKEVDFLNTEDLLFRLSDSILTAESSQLLNFRNNYLGYDIRCYMAEYSRDNKNLKFSGKASFKDFEVSKRKKKKYQKRREELWKVSQQNFFRSVISNSLDEKKYSCTALNPNKIINGYQKVMDFTDFVYPTKNENVYALITPAPISIETEGHISHIIPKDGIILVNKGGIILNKDEVELRGYWEQMSFTKYLPTDFKPIDNLEIGVDSKAKKSIGELRLWARDLMDYSKNNRSLDEISLETDRYFYKSYERVFVSAHIFDHKNRYPIDNCLVKVELVNQENEVLASKTKLATKGVCHTSFQLSDTLPKAQYGIRAYTSQMRNFSENLYGKTNIAVGLMQDHNVADTKDSIFIHFAPEGGSFLNDLENRIVAKIKDRKGNLIDFKGWVSDGTTDDKIALNTTLPGLAVINLVPTEASRYQVMTGTNQPIASNINELIPKSGTNLLALSRYQDRFIFTISSNRKEDKSQLIRILHKGRKVYEFDLEEGQTSYSVSKDFLPNEVLVVNLYDDENRLLSQRLINNKHEIESFVSFKKKYQFFYADQLSEISIDIDSLSNYFVDSLIWNVRVVHSEYLDKGSRSDYLEVQPAQWDEFDNLSSNNKLYIRNLELIGNAVDRDYLSAYDYDIKDYKYKEDFSFSLSGVLKDPDEPKYTEKGKVSITSMASNLYYEEVLSNEEGEFRFDKLPYAPNHFMVIQARKNVGKDDDILEGDRYLKIELDTNYTTAERSNTAFHYRQDLIPDTSKISYHVNPVDEFSLSVELDEVLIKGRVKAQVRTGEVKDLEEMDWIPKQVRGLNLLKRLYPGKIVRRSLTVPGELELRVTSAKYGFIYVPIRIFINEFEEYGSSGFEALEADRIKYLSLGQTIQNETVLAIITTPGSISRTSRRESDLGIVNHTIPETIDDTDISIINDYSPRQASGSDYRKTLYWNPNFLITNSNKKEVVFRASQMTGEYQIIASTIHPQLGRLSFMETIKIED